MAAGGPGARQLADDREASLTETVLMSFDDDLARSLNPLFGAVWNAAGCARSGNFSRDGDWAGA